MTNQNPQKNVPPLLIGQGIPEYSAITPKQIETYMPVLLNDLTKQFDALEQELSKKTEANAYLQWEEVMTPLYKIEERLRWSWGVICHLNAVCNTEELRNAHSAQQPEVVRLSNRFGQSKPLHKALSTLNSQKVKGIDKTQRRILQRELLSMKHRGVGLEGSEREAFNRASERLAELATKFSNNVLDATKGWSLLLTKRSDIEGLPARALEVLSNAAKEAGDKNKDLDCEATPENGPWRVGLDMPRYIPFMTYAKNRSIREILYKAHVKRASHGELNNNEIINEILLLRNSQSKRLGYKNWAELSLAGKMAKNVEKVETLLEELRAAAMPAAKRELKELEACAADEGAAEAFNLAPWDISFWSECLRQKRFNLNQELLRPWFPLPQVLDSLFKLCERLFDISIKAADGEKPIWQEDVRYFEVCNSDGTRIAAFYLDPYSRPKNKRGGAWMDECLTRSTSQEGKIVLPVAYLVCNQTPATDETPSLMSFEEVQTLFHEFGHGLQHMLTKVNHPQAAGINNVEWDAVELPSQFMENWCLDRYTLKTMARHWKTKAELPETEFTKLRLSRTFNSGMATLRQIHFALTDLKLHSLWNKELGLTPDELRRQIAITTTVIRPIIEDQFLCAFSHIFAGGYAAGYYSYKWAEVLSADAFSAFEEVGVDDEEKVKAIGRRFRDTVLALGGSKSPNEVFKEFRGRNATTEALIRHSGLDIKGC